MTKVSQIFCNIPAIVPLQVGARVILNMRSRGDDWETHAFYDKYNHQVATVDGFTVEYVGPLDSHGRLPGVYPNGETVQIKFRDGKKQSVYPFWLLLAEPVTTCAVENFEGAGRPQPLPHPIRFYPGDQVRKKDDASEEVRVVHHVDFHGNRVRYHLSESASARQMREEKLAEAKQQTESIFSIRLAMSQAERSDGKGLLVVSRGNVHHLYEAPEKLRFENDEAEVAFWAQEGVSHGVFYGSGREKDFQWPLVDAQKACADGKGDLITRVSEEHLRVMVGIKGEYLVHRLHDCFAMHRERVRAVAGRVKVLPEADELELSTQERARRIIGIR